MTALVVAAVALAVALAVPPGADLASFGRRPRPAPPRWVVPVTGGAGVGLAVAVGLPARVVALAAVLAAAGWATAGLVRRRRRRRAADAAADRVGEVCDALAADLAAGRPAGAALARSCEGWDALGGVAAAYDVGADVAHALRSASRTPGCADLRLVAAAWDVAHRTGTGLAGAVTRVADGVRARGATRRVVRSELASARSTARLLAGLPVLALLMGTGAGGSPWRFLLATPAGVACLAVGLALGLAGLWWIEAIADDVEGGS